MRVSLPIGTAVILTGVAVWGAAVSTRPELPRAAQVDVETFPVDVAIQQFTDRTTLLEEELASAKGVQHRLMQRIAELEEQLSVHSESHGKNAAEARTTNDIGEDLIHLGLPEHTVNQILHRLGKNRMDLLSMRDQAAREGWMDTSEYANMLDDLADPSEDIRSEFGDDVYDYYLYAADKPNRVLVTDVYRNSAADAAGIQAGDLVLRYGSESVFSMLDLKQATVGGRSGESALVELQRNGGSIFVTVPRGPIGITMAGQQVAPDNVLNNSR